MLAPVRDYASGSAALGGAVARLRGEELARELGRVVREVMASEYGRLVAPPRPGGRDEAGAAIDVIAAGGRTASISHQLACDIEFDQRRFGRFLVARAAPYDTHERDQLADFAALAGSLLHGQAMARQSEADCALLEEQLQQQSQVLDQIHESVLTMDTAGFITSWNRGAERLFGYTADEAVGQNVLFLYGDDDQGVQDPFLEHGGRLMEVRRKNKAGDVFWASLSLSPLQGADGRSRGMIASLSDITGRKQAEEKIHNLAYYDALTGLPNRTLLTKLADQALTVAQRSGVQGCMLFVDINRFKQINDTLGRATGDELLRQVAQRFRAALREQDLVARLGSDEFAIGLFEIRQHFEATLVAQKLLTALQPAFLIEGHDLRVDASIGISVYPQDGADAETLLRLADIAMFRAKQGGQVEHENVAFYSRDMNRGMHERMRLESALRRALYNNELLLHYQPKYALDTGSIIGAEALVRWQHPERGMIPPAQFIPLAEATGLVVQLGEWVLEAACKDARRWQRAGIGPFRLAINVSAREFTSQLPARLAAMLDRYELSAEWLELEITESTLMHDIDRVIGIMDRITAMGVTLSLDDFGTGYSSLSYLKRFPIDTLKIDRSFTTGIPGDANDCAIASTIISIARQLKHKVIAEGVETPEQAAFLKQAGCDQAQGYWFSRPLAADVFERTLRGDLPRRRVHAASSGSLG
jgi:diguanylate cyclase (GGDEF)-like protein/PAS domain S-box-containing protein